MVSPKIPLLMMAVCGLLMAGCGSVSQAVAERRDASTAHNQMMLVRENPGTLGYRRLMAKSAESGDLKIFIEQTGLPDFLAEANSSDREYLIFYYLERRQAFACRTPATRAGQVEFAGPYKMTANELKLLKAARAKARQGAAADA
jgi:hypothetical protein